MDFESDGFVDAKRLLWEANFNTQIVDFESDGLVDAKRPLLEASCCNPRN